MRDVNASFNERVDGPKFIRAALDFKDDPADLLYRLTNPQVGKLSPLWHNAAGKGHAATAASSCVASCSLIT